jgi:hypothetical protein
MPSQDDPSQEDYRLLDITGEKRYAAEMVVHF